MTENEIGTIILEESIRIHRNLGPGLLESVYEIMLKTALLRRELSVVRQAIIPIVFDEVVIKEGFRADLIVENKIIIELKSVESLNKLHHKQLKTYLMLSGLKLGYLLNFGSLTMKDGIKRIVNGLED